MDKNVLKNNELSDRKKNCSLCMYVCGCVIFMYQKSLCHYKKIYLEKKKTLQQFYLMQHCKTI